MKKIIFISFAAAITAVSFAQHIERKIIVEQGRFYFTTIDEQFQVGSLNTGSYTEALKTAKQLALPAGRNYSDPIIPFSWDVEDTNLYAINFLMHPLNDRNEALKRISISSLKEWGPETTALNMIMQGTDLDPFAYNDPYSFVIKRSNTLENFFFDGIAVNDTAYFMAISNHGEISIWNYSGKKWKHAEPVKFPVDGYFSLFAFDKKIYLVLHSGALYEISGTGIFSVQKDCGSSLANGFVIINKDENTVSFMKNTELNQNMPLDELIKKKAIRIF